MKDECIEVKFGTPYGSVRDIEPRKLIIRTG